MIRDKKTGDSLQYAFVEFENQKSCEAAYFKMDNVLIDDRRIHVSLICKHFIILPFCSFKQPLADFIFYHKKSYRLTSASLCPSFGGRAKAGWKWSAEAEATANPKGTTTDLRRSLQAESAAEVGMTDGSEA